jgi:hypothetical protein
MVKQADQEHFMHTKAHFSDVGMRRGLLICIIIDGRFQVFQGFYGYNRYKPLKAVILL